MEKLVFIGDLQPYQAQISNQRSRQYRRLLEQADRYFTYELPAEHPKESTTYMGIAIVNLALAFHLSKKERYLLEAKRFMTAVLQYQQWGNAHLVNVDLSASWILFGLSLGYDWLKPYLTETEKKEVSEKIQHHAKIMYEYKLETYGNGWSTHYYQNHNWINLTGLAAAGYVLSGECEAAQTYIDEAKDNFEKVYSLLADDGSNYEGVPYWRYGGMWLFVYAHLLKTQEGMDYFKTCNYLKNTFYYRLYQSCGDLEQQLNFGDSHDRHSGHAACVYYKAAAEYRDGYAQNFAEIVLDEFLMKEAVESKIKPGILPEAAFEFLWYAPEVEKKELSELPKARYFKDLGLLSIRENWTRESKVLSIKCGYPGGKKQWINGWRMFREEGIDCLALSHHHPDNLSYIVTRGSEYLTCEDGYNRNIMPDNHNVLLVDGVYTDAVDENDIYVTSAKMRLEQDSSYPIEERYCGNVTRMEQDGDFIIYQGETSGIYPDALEMQEVSRLLFTDGLSFFVYVNRFRSDKAHQYQVIANTDMPAVECGSFAYTYPMKTGMLNYTVFSDKGIVTGQYTQEVVSVMTTQEPDKVCKVCMNTLSHQSKFKEKEQVILECFTFDEENTTVLFTDGILCVINHGTRYEYHIASGEIRRESI